MYTKTCNAELNHVLGQIVELTGDDPHAYTSNPGDGPARYVFQHKVCLGVREAITYAKELLAEARMDYPTIAAGLDVEGRRS